MKTQRARCLLHVGTEKTGSTSLQHFLKLNAGPLASRNIWIPRSLVPNPDRDPFNHILLSTASRLSQNKPDDLQTQLGLSSMDAVKEHRETVTQALRKEYAELPFDPSMIIISNEHVHSRLRADEDLKNAQALIEPFCSDFRVIAYLRSQHELAQSLAVTSVKNGKTEFRRVPDFSSANGFDPVLGADKKYFDYSFLLGRLERVFGADALDVRLYAKGELYGDDIIEDFFGRADIDISGLRKPNRENTSMNETALHFLAALNRYLPRNSETAQIRRRILNVLATRYAGSAPPAPVILLDRFMEQFAESNADVCKKWFPARTSLFRERRFDSKPQRESAGLSEAELFGVFISISQAFK